jgi:DNA replication protein DnaC
MELENLLTKLKMDHLEAQIDAVCEQASQRQMDYKTFLFQALETEWQGRYQRGIEARLRQARFLWIKTLDQFDFDFQPSIDRRQVRELTGSWTRLAICPSPNSKPACSSAWSPAATNAPV